MPSRHHIGGGWIRSDRRLGIYLRDGFGCVWCQMCLTGSHPNNVTLDHLLPREQLGGNESTNLVTSCKGCNVRRGLKTVAQFAAELGAECFPDQPQEARSYARDTIVRIRHQRRLAPNLALARAILAGLECDPRPMVVEARRTGRVLAPRGSGAAKQAARAKRRQRRVAKSLQAKSA